MTQKGKPAPLNPLLASLKRIFQGPAQDAILRVLETFHEPIGSLKDSCS
jgi:hypothetical protein